MRISRNFILLLFLLYSQITIKAQDPGNHPFSNGKPIGVVFSNFHTGINQGNNPSAFEIRRAYLGYNFNLDNHYSAKIELDIGSPDDISQYSLLRRFAYFKEANLQYKGGKITARFGIIPLQQFKLQEKIWGHRYVYESALDQHGLGSSADLGASVNYRATSFLQFDLTLMNGEGYSQLQADYSYKTGFGFTLRPWKGLIIRNYVDMIQKSEMLLTIVNFVGWEIPDKLSVGLEHNIKLNNDFEKDQNIRVFSGYLSYQINSYFELFGRYDILSSNKSPGSQSPWNLNNDGSAIIAGIQYTPLDKVNLALNYQDWVPYAQNLANQSYIFLNVEFRLW
jgi:hypothetical protein